jgi:hypothetical protein
MRTYFWNCIIYNIDNTIPERALQQAYQKPVALGQSVNSNVAPVARVVGHPCYRRSTLQRSREFNFSLPQSLQDKKAEKTCDNFS